MSNTEMPIAFEYETDIELPHASLLQKFLLQLFSAEKKAVDFVTFCFCTDEKILEINRDYLHHDYFTDIITFEMNQHGEDVMADIFISVDTVKSNAEVFGKAFLDELHRVIFHGALHLCGYNDKNDTEKQEMRKKEDLYLAGYGRFLQNGMFHVKQD